MADGQNGNGRAAELKRSLALQLLAAIALLVIVLGLCSLLASQGRGSTAAVGIGGMIFLAAASIGGVLGFLFAVPRVLAQGDTDLVGGEGDPGGGGGGGGTPPVSGSPAEGAAVMSTSAAPAAAQRRALRNRLLRSNTNLERISDWLTTMLVGVGLSQLGNIDDALVRFRRFLAEEVRIPSAEPATAAAAAASSAGVLPAIGPMLLIFGLVIGFLFLYLYTRLVLTGLFHDVERTLDMGGDPGEQPVTDPQAKEAVAHFAENLRDTSENPTLHGLSVGSDPSVAESLTVMMGLLYRPGGYQDVIDLGSKLAATPARQKAEYWFYLAAAFGQKYQDLQQQNEPENRLVSTRDNALDCARRAVEIDPSYRARLWAISNPDNLDNDLAPFRKDPTFRTIVGIG